MNLDVNDLTNVIEGFTEVFDLGNKAVDFVEKIKKSKKNQDEDNAVIKSSGDSAQIGSSGDFAQIGSSGNYAKIGSSGNYAKIGSSGYYAKIGSSGDYAKIGSSGDSAQIGSSGDFAQIGSSGNYAKIGSSGNYAKIGSSGYSAKIGSSGDSAKIGSSGYSAKIGSSGDSAVISALGQYSTVSAKKGSWITLAEYRYNSDKNAYIPICVKTEYVDGEKIKEDTEYALYKCEFREVIRADKISSIIIKKKGNVFKVVNFGNDFDNEKITYLIKTNDGVYSHGETLKEAKDSLIYKISNRDTSQYENLKKSDKVTKEDAIKMYRVITGACEAGTRYFIENVLSVDKKEYKISEIIKLTDGQYGNETFKEFFN